jgi:hypothetical protein
VLPESVLAFDAPLHCSSFGLLPSLPCLRVLTETDLVEAMLLGVMMDNRKYAEKDRDASGDCAGWRLPATTACTFALLRQLTPGPVMGAGVLGTMARVRGAACGTHSHLLEAAEAGGGACDAEAAEPEAAEPQITRATPSFTRRWRVRYIQGIVKKYAEKGAMGRQSVVRQTGNGQTVRSQADRQWADSP